MDLKKLNKKYKQQEKEAKKAYKEENGLKIARGFKQSDESKRIAKNRRQAIYRFNKKQKFNKFKEAGAKGFQNEFILETGKPFYNTLSYGSGADKAAMNFFKQGKRAIGKKFTAIIDTSQILGERKSYDSEIQYDFAMKRLYQYCIKIQKEYDLDSSQPEISIVEGDYNGDTFFTVMATTRQPLV